MNQFIENVREYISTNCILKQGQTVIVGLSGGADSVALLVTLHELGYRCIAAHCNFHLRGEESMRDFRHAKFIADRYSEEFICKDFNVPEYKALNGVSTEMACRDLRYDWFRELSSRNGQAPVAVAHHLDDNIETMFLNLLRGTGINGAHGMSPQNGIIVRPFLSMTRDEILKFLKDTGVSYVTDSSNMINDVKRNKLRNIILPSIRGQFPDAVKGLSTSLANLEGNDRLYSELIDIVSSRYITPEGIAVENMIKDIDNSTLFLYEIIKTKGFNFTQAEDIIYATKQRSSGKSFLTTEHKAVLDRGFLKITSLSLDDSNATCIIDLNSTEINHPLALMLSRITPRDMTIDRTGRTLYLDSGILKETNNLTLRHWHNGDRFCPFGLKGSKLVSDIFTDLKMSIIDKQKVWLLCDKEKILWIVGHKCSKFYPVTGESDEVIKITVK